MKITIDVVEGRDPADLQHALQDPQVQAFVFKVGQMIRFREPPCRVIEFIESQLYSWRLPRTPARRAHTRKIATHV